MLNEIPHPKQNLGEPPRRWFYDGIENLDLIVWQEQEQIVGFQLCYLKDEQDERAVTWRAGKGFSHDQVDSGENRPGKHKSSPVLMPDGSFDYRHIAERFRVSSANIDSRVAEFVYHMLLQYRE